MAEEENIQTAAVGERLKACREQKDISLTDIASRLHLDSRIVRAIEENDYDNLPDPIYVRGYIRNYCKLLGENADEFLELFKTSSGREDPEIIPEIRHPSQTSSSDKPVKAFTYLISLGLVLLVFAWWQSNYVMDTQPSNMQPPVNKAAAPEPDPPPEQPVIEELVIEEEAEATPLTETEPGNMTVEPGGLTGERTDDGMGQIMEDDGTEMVEDTVTDVVTEPPVNLSLEERATESREDPADGESEEPPGDPPASGYVEPETDDSPAPTGTDTLVLRLTADSWIEIFDANDQQIFFDLGRTGDRLTLNGTAPFDILLGFAQGVSIEYNGQPVDQSPYTRAGVARFTLGE